MTREGGPLLEAEGLVVRFGAVRALDGVSLTVRAGEVQALLGENGAGKSTLIKCLSGVVRPTGGRMVVCGRRIEPRSPHEAERLGIATVFQEVGLIPRLSVAENICLGREPGRRWLRGLVDWRAVRSRARAAMERLGLGGLDVDRELGACSIAVQQMVAIARALDVRARVLILDEPTSSLDRDECARLLGVIGQLRTQGMGIVFISHFLDQVEAIADRVTVLRDGKLVGSFEAAGLTRAKLVSLMVGREFEMPTGKAETAGARGAGSLLSLRAFGRSGMIEGVDADVGAGEAVGLAGLLGSGRSETARLVFGAETATRGTMTFRGEAARFTTPRQAIARGMGMLPENRKDQGVFPSLSVVENLVVSLRAKDGAFSRLAFGAQVALAEEFVRRLGIKTPGVHAKISELSGGNQQKVLLARWFATRPVLLILDEPTRGIDVAAKADVLRAVDRLRGEGTAVLFISSELEEVTRVCGRVVVLRDRRSVAHLEGSDITEASVLAAVARTA